MHRTFNWWTTKVRVGTQSRNQGRQRPMCLVCSGMYPFFQYCISSVPHPPWRSHRARMYCSRWFPEEAVWCEFALFGNYFSIRKPGKPKGFVSINVRKSLKLEMIGIFCISLFHIRDLHLRKIRGSSGGAFSLLGDLGICIQALLAATSWQFSAIIELLCVVLTTYYPGLQWNPLKDWVEYMGGCMSKNGAAIKHFPAVLLNWTKHSLQGD